MARKRKLAEVWHHRVSSSISNWRNKIEKRYGLPTVNWPIFENTLFFGLYHPLDYLRFLLCRGKRKVFWAGSDILALEKTTYWKRIIARINAEHICENYVEQQKLREMGIKARVQPICLSTPYPELSYRWTEDAHVYLTMRKGSEDAYGRGIIVKIASKFPNITFHLYGCYCMVGKNKNIIWHGIVSEEEFNKDIKNYHACIRLNKHDGFGDALAKSCLMGQWPISAIAYPYTSHAPNLKTLIGALEDLKDKKTPNCEGRAYWLRELSKDLV